MAEILVKAVDSKVDSPGAYKRGYPVAVVPDNHPWGNLECLPKFVVIKVPLISVAVVRKYIEEYSDDTYHRRRWTIKWDDLPAGAKNKLQTAGQLVIKATLAYTGDYDYTWVQIKAYFLNLQTGETETADL